MFTFGRAIGFLAEPSALGYLLLLLTTAILLTAAVATYLVEPLWALIPSLDRGGADGEWVQTAAATALLCALGGLSFARWRFGRALLPLTIEKFVFSLLFAGQVITIVVIANLPVMPRCAYRIRQTISPLILFLLISAVWLSLTARFTARPFFRRWARALQEPASS